VRNKHEARLSSFFFLGAAGSALTYPNESLTFQTKPQGCGPADPERRCSGQVRAGLDRRRSEIRPDGTTSSTVGNPGTKYVIEVQRRGFVMEGRPGRPAYRSTRAGSEPSPRRESGKTVVEIATNCPARGVGSASQAREGAGSGRCLRVRGDRGGGIRHRQPGPPSWLLIAASGREQELKVLRLERGRREAESTLGLVACKRPGGGVL